MLKNENQIYVLSDYFNQVQKLNDKRISMNATNIEKKPSAEDMKIYIKQTLNKWQIALYLTIGYSCHEIVKPLIKYIGKIAEITLS